MDLSNIKKLVKIIEDSSITDFSLEEKELKITISKKAEQIVTSMQPQQIQAQQHSTQVKETPSDREDSTEKMHEVCSPIVGTFYRAPAPDADPYIQIGDKVAAGNVMCIIEAMKLMNEIESDVNGKVVKILVENGAPVEYNQPLFLVKPD